MPHPSNKWTAPKGLRFISTVRCCIPHPPRHIHTFQTWFNNIIYSWTKYQRNDNETIQRMRYMAVEHNWGRIRGSRTLEGWSCLQDCRCARRCWRAWRNCRLAHWRSPLRSGLSWTPSHIAWVDISWMFCVIVVKLGALLEIGLIVLCSKSWVVIEKRRDLSTQTTGVPFWAKGSLVFVAQGIVNQSVEQPVPTWRKTVININVFI